MCNSVNDAATTLTNSGVYEWFDFDSINEHDVVEYMYRNDATPESAAEHFDVA